MDATSVSIATGAAYKRASKAHLLTMAAVFGIFQAVMPLIGYLAGLTFRHIIQSYDHWIAFGILLILGLKMLYESFQLKPEKQDRNPHSLTTLFVLAVATSIDALAVGITVSVLKMPILVAASVIGIITFALSYSGAILGKKIGHFFENRIEALGGLVLIGIGLKILISHL